MMVPRSYRYSSVQHSHSSKSLPQTKRRTGNSPAASRLDGSRSSPSSASSTTATKHVDKMENLQPSAPKGTSSGPATVHSDPVVIPARSHSGNATPTQKTRNRSRNGTRRGRTPVDHNPKAIPPAVAALLAVTAIPPPRRDSSQCRRGTSMEQRISIDELIQEWRAEEKEASSIPYNSPLDILLERVDDNDVDDASFDETTYTEREYGASRSSSSESIPSVPSLEVDERSLPPWSAPSTPVSVSRRSKTERREKIVSSPPTEDCVLDHPLLHDGSDESDGSITPIVDIDARKKSLGNFRASLKSNLTASLQALKSAAKSFSNFAAPSIPPDDFLTRSMLTPRYASEMRPKPLQGVPDPALRRYLNPTAVHTPLSLSELSVQLHKALSHSSPADDPENPGAPMIQMQTYERRSRSRTRKSRSSSKPSSAIDPLSEAGRAMNATPQIRQREPRENSDFLRVIVLEMNMRREGKLDAKALGRARIWLPPRKPDKPDVEAEGGVPVRWVGVAVDEA